MNNELLVKSIRELCKKNNVAVSQLENDLNFGAGLISRWVKSSPSLDKIVDIADYFHVTLDEVVGHNNITNDKFLEKLISQTEERIIQWNVYDNQNEEQPKQYFGYSYLKVDDFRSINDFNDFISFHKEISYYVQIDNGYISLYGQYNGFNITKPEELKLFIQASKESELIPQEYNTKQLVALWLKILNTIGTSAPDEVKAEELKNNFILNKSLTNSDDVLSGNLNNDLDIDVIEKIANDPSVKKIMELYSMPGFQQLQKTISSPEFQKAMQTASMVQKHFDRLNINNK